MGWVTAVLIVLLIVTLIAYFSGAFPYPFGWLILVTILIGRFANCYRSENPDQ